MQAPSYHIIARKKPKKDKRHKRRKQQADAKRQFKRDLEKERQSKKQAQASARAKLAGQGRSLQDGSAGALIDGLNRRAIKSESQLTEDYNAQQRRSLLSTKQYKHHNLDRLFGIGKSFGNYF